MKAAILYEVNKPLVVEDGVTVDSPGKGEVKVKVAFTAVCHSDLHFFTGDIPSPLPGLAGHETAGYVDEIGEAVTKVKKGDTVVIGTVTSGCGQCYYCKIGKPHYCVERGAFNRPKHKNSQGAAPGVNGRTRRRLCRIYHGPAGADHRHPQKYAAG